MLAWPATVFVILPPLLTRELASLRHDIGFNKPFFSTATKVCAVPLFLPSVCFWAYPQCVVGPLDCLCYYVCVAFGNTYSCTLIYLWLHKRSSTSKINFTLTLRPQELLGLRVRFAYKLKLVFCEQNG